MTKAYFNDTDYVFSHGQSPRGDGAWAFSFERFPETLDKIFFVMGRFATAKKVAAKKAKAEGAREVFVQP